MPRHFDTHEKVEWTERFGYPKEYRGTAHWVSSYRDQYVPRDILSSRNSVLPPIRSSDEKHGSPRRMSGNMLDNQIKNEIGFFVGHPERADPLSPHNLPSSPQQSPRRIYKEARNTLKAPYGESHRNTTPINLYQSISSPTCAAVSMVAKMLGLKLNQIEVDVIKGEHTTQNFIEHTNPLGTIPVINDKGVKVAESGAIMRYLVREYSGQDDILYPKDTVTQAGIDSLMDYQATTLQSAVTAFIGPRIFGGPPNAIEEEKVHNCLEFLNGQLNYGRYFVGDKISIADCAIIATLALLDAAKFDFGPWHRLAIWIDRMKSSRVFQECFRPYYSIMANIG